MFGCTSVADSPAQPRQNQPAADLCYKTDISSLMDFNSPDTALDKGEVIRLIRKHHICLQ